MPLPKTIHEPYEHDALVLLPVADPLPPSPAAQVPALAAALEAHLAGSDAPALPAITGSMRTAQRNAQARQNASRLGAAQARVALDDAEVHHRTAEYELARVREEMAVCRAYEPLYETIPMPGEADFVASADAEVLASLREVAGRWKLTLALESDAMARKYGLLLARLEAELATIQAQEARVAELTVQRDALVRSRRDVMKKSEAVDVLLADYSKTSAAMSSKIRDVVRAAEKDKDKEKARESPEKERTEAKESKA